MVYLKVIFYSFSRYVFLLVSWFMWQSVCWSISQVVDSWFASLAVNTLVHNFKLVCCTVHYGLVHCDWNEVWTYCCCQETWWSLPNLSSDNHCRQYIQIYEYYVMKNRNCNHNSCLLSWNYEVTMIKHLRYIKKIIIIVNNT